MGESIEAGLAKPSDPDVRARLKRRRLEIAANDEELRAVEKAGTGKRDRELTPEVIERFSAMMRQALRGPDPHLRQGDLRMLVSEVRLSSQDLTIRGARPDLERAVARAADTPGAPVPASARTWRARNDSNVRPPDS